MKIWSSWRASLDKNGTFPYKNTKFLQENQEVLIFNGVKISWSYVITCAVHLSPEVAPERIRLWDVTLEAKTDRSFLRFSASCPPWWASISSMSFLLHGSQLSPRDFDMHVSVMGDLPTANSNERKPNNISSDLIFSRASNNVFLFFFLNHCKYIKSFG